MSWAFCCTRRGRLPSPNGFPSYSTLPHSVKRGWPAYRPDMACSSVDLPEPDGPSSAVMLPRGKVRSMSARTTLAPKAAPKPAALRQCVLLFMCLMGGIVPVRGQSRPTENRSACTDQRTKRPPERGQRRLLFYGVVRGDRLVFRAPGRIMAWAAFTQLNEHAHRPGRTNSDPVARTTHGGADHQG